MVVGVIYCVCNDGLSFPQKYSPLIDYQYCLVVTLKWHHASTQGELGPPTPQEKKQQKEKTLWDPPPKKKKKKKEKEKRPERKKREKKKKKRELSLRILPRRTRLLTSLHREKARKAWPTATILMRPSNLVRFMYEIATRTILASCGILLKRYFNYFTNYNILILTKFWGLRTFMMSSSSVKRKTEEDLMDSVKKVKQSDSTETKYPNKDKMASTSLDDRQGEDGADMSVPPGIRLLFSNLSNDIQSSHDKLSKRLDSLEEDLQGKIKELVSVAIKAEVDKVRTEYSAEINSLKAKVSSLEKSYADVVRVNGMSSAAAFEERKKRIVVRGIPCDRNETAQVSKDKVSALIRDGCKLSNVKVTQAERKFSKGKKPGPIIATIETFEQKQSLMKNKNSLKNVNKYKKVYIENDYSPETRNTDSNLRTILKEIGKDKQYRVAGGKIFSARQDNGNGNGNNGRD